MDGDGASLAKPAVLFSGFLTKRGHVRKNWKRRHFELTQNGLLQYFSLESHCRLAGSIDLSQCTKILPGGNCKITWCRLANPYLCFGIYTSAKHLFLFAQSKEDLEGWLTALQRVVPQGVSITTPEEIVLSWEGKLSNLPSTVTNDCNVLLRVTIFPNGKPKGGRVIALPSSLDKLRLVASGSLGFPVVAVFTPEGHLIEDINLIKDNDIIVVSSGQTFCCPTDSLWHPRLLTQTKSAHVISNKGSICSQVSSNIIKHDVEIQHKDGNIQHKNGNHTVSSFANITTSNKKTNEQQISISETAHSEPIDATQDIACKNMESNNKTTLVMKPTAAKPTAEFVHNPKRKDLAEMTATTTNNSFCEKYDQLLSTSTHDIPANTNSKSEILKVVSFVDSLPHIMDTSDNSGESSDEILSADDEIAHLDAMLRTLDAAATERQMSTRNKQKPLVSDTQVGKAPSQNYDSLEMIYDNLDLALDDPEEPYISLEEMKTLRELEDALMENNSTNSKKRKKQRNKYITQTAHTHRQVQPFTTTVLGSNTPQLSASYSQEQYQQRRYPDNNDDRSSSASSTCEDCDAHPGYLEVPLLRGVYGKDLSESDYVTMTKGNDEETAYMSIGRGLNTKDGYMEVVRENTESSGYMEVVRENTESDGYMEVVRENTESDRYMEVVRENTESSGYMEVIRENTESDGYIEVRHEPYDSGYVQISGIVDATGFVGQKHTIDNENDICSDDSFTET